VRANDSAPLSPTAVRGSLDPVEDWQTEIAQAISHGFVILGLAQVTNTYKNALEAYTALIRIASAWRCSDLSAGHLSDENDNTLVISLSHLRVSRDVV
jgi:hypothetical protein